jgi:hypothetical protein
MLNTADEAKLHIMYGKCDTDALQKRLHHMETLVAEATAEIASHRAMLVSLEAIRQIYTDEMAWFAAKV